VLQETTVSAGDIVTARYYKIACCLPRERHKFAI